MKAFLCFPNEHEDEAREIVNFVRSVGVECWFYKDDVVAGEDWNRAGKLALKEADVVITICSNITNERDGVFQRELNEALEYEKSRRPGSVYLLPIRVADVALPDELARFHYVDFFEGNWRNKLATGLQRALQQRNEDVPLPLQVASAQSDAGGISAHSIEEQNDLGAINADWITYDSSDEYWRFVNAAIISRALGGVYEARRNIQEWGSRHEGLGSYWDFSIQEYHRKDLLVSLTISSSEYWSGAAHPNHGVSTLNILGPKAGIVTAADLFDHGYEALTFLTEFVNLDLKRQYRGGQNTIDVSNYVLNHGWEVFSQLNFNEEGMEINLSGASGLPHVYGFHSVYVSWKHVEDFLAPVARSILRPRTDA